MIREFAGTLFSRTGALIALYVIAGIVINTAAPHLPPGISSPGTAHSWIQYGISVFTWPLHWWQPVFTTGKWTP